MPFTSLSWSLSVYQALRNVKLSAIHPSLLKLNFHCLNQNSVSLTKIMAVYILNNKIDCSNQSVLRKYILSNSQNHHKVHSMLVNSSVLVITQLFVHIPTKFTNLPKCTKNKKSFGNHEIDLI